MALLIDAFNVLHTTGVLPAEHAGIEVEDLIALISVSRYRRHRCTLVCDGTGMSHHQRSAAGDIRVLYSGPSRSADDVIIDMVRADTAPKLLTVVTSDAAIRKAARKRRCPLLRANVFLAHLAHDIDDPKLARPKIRRAVDPLPRDEVKKWIHAFDLTDAELELLAADEDQFALDDEPAEQPADPSKQPTPPPLPKPQSIAGLPKEMIEQAEQLWGDQPAAPVRAPKDPPKQPDHDTQPADEQSTDSSRSNTPQPRTDDENEYDVNEIDMSELMPDVKPMRDDNDKR